MLFFEEHQSEIFGVQTMVNCCENSYDVKRSLGGGGSGGEGVLRFSEGMLKEFKVKYLGNKDRGLMGERIVGRREGEGGSDVGRWGGSQSFGWKKRGLRGTGLADKFVGKGGITASVFMGEGSECSAVGSRRIGSMEIRGNSEGRISRGSQPSCADSNPRKTTLQKKLETVTERKPSKQTSNQKAHNKSSTFNPLAS